MLWLPPFHRMGRTSRGTGAEGGCPMTLVDLVGYLASALVLLAFCMRAMIPLRTVALCSNIAFLLYGFNHALMPVVLLHAVLVPVNCWRLWEALQDMKTGEPTSEIVAQSSISSSRLS
jgi:hypothetical protein